MSGMSRNAWLVPLVLLLAVCAAYGNSLHNAYQFDDYNVIVNSAAVHSWSAWYADVAHGLRPLLKLSYTLNWISGPDVWGFHLLNIAVHFLNVLLVYALARRLLVRSPEIVAPGIYGPAMLAALLFAVHPVNTEAITYISGRSMSLMTLFYLAALLAYIKGREDGRALWLYGVSPLLFILAAATKETAVTLPFALVLWEICYTRTASLKNLLRAQGLHWLVFLLLALSLLFHDRYWKLMEFSAGLHSVQVNFYTQLHAMSYLAGQMLLPWRMNIDPDLPVIGSWNQVWRDGVLWLGLAVAGIWHARRWPWLGFALGWFVLQLFPLYVFLPRLDVANDRQLYLAGWVMLLPVATWWAGWFGRGAFRYGLAATLLLTLTGLTLIRNEVYRSEVALWEDTVRNSPHKARSYNNLGYAYYVQGNFALAERSYMTALSLHPDYWLAENNLAVLRNKRQMISVPEE